MIWVHGSGGEQIDAEKKGLWRNGYGGDAAPAELDSEQGWARRVRAHRGGAVDWRVLLIRIDGKELGGGGGEWVAGGDCRWDWRRSSRELVATAEIVDVIWAPCGLVLRRRQGWQRRRFEQ